MKIELVAKNYTISESLNEVITKKVTKLDKYFEDDAICRIYLKKENKECKIEISFQYRGTTIRAEAKAEHFYDSIDLVIPKLERQIRKQRTRLEEKLKKGSFVEIVEESEEDNLFKLVKTKQFETVPMSIEDAISEFELLGYSFFVFCDSVDKKIKVLYLRDDGNIGLIDPIVTK